MIEKPRNETGPTGSNSARWKSRAIVLAAVVGCGILFLRDPVTPGFYPPCLFRAATGLHCPGCGSLRAMHQLLHGRVLKALSFNPLAMLAVPIFAYVLLSEALVAVGRRPLLRVSIPAVWIWALLAVMILFAILRNIPGHPFTLLAP